MHAPSHLPADVRAKERVRLFDEVEKAVGFAASISTYLYQYKASHLPGLPAVGTCGLACTDAVPAVK